MSVGADGQHNPPLIAEQYRLVRGAKPSDRRYNIGRAVEVEEAGVGGPRKRERVGTTRDGQRGVGTHQDGAGQFEVHCEVGTGQRVLVDFDGEDISAGEEKVER